MSPRSSSAVIAYRMHRDGLGYDEALAAVRAVRPSVRPNEGFVAQLRAFEARREEGSTLVHSQEPQ